MDRIKKLKIKKQDGTFSDYIPIGADAENENITIAGDLYQSKLLLFNNQFIGYTGINNTPNATKWNNYLSTDGTSNTLIS